MSDHTSRKWLRERYQGADGEMTIAEMAEDAGVTYEAMRGLLDRRGLLEEKVECRICGESFRQITNTHLQKHGLTVEKYKNEYPDALMGENVGWEEGLWMNADGQDNPMEGMIGEDHHRFVEREEVECKNCGILFETVPSIDRKYCDRECYMEDHRGVTYSNHQQKLSEADGNYSVHRKEALERDDCQCRVCGSDQNLHAHHIVPLSEGGSNYTYNLGIVCGSCHRSTVERPKSRYSEATRKVEIDTGHRLYHHDWKCQNPHGHRYKIELTVGGLVNEEMMIADFGKLKELMWDVLDDDIDHGMLLNEKDEEFIKLCEEKGWRYRTMDGDPTVENISTWLLDQFEEYAEREMSMYRARWRIVGIRVWETPNCSVGLEMR